MLDKKNFEKIGQVPIGYLYIYHSYVLQYKESIIVSIVIGHCNGCDL